MKQKQREVMLARAERNSDIYVLLDRRGGLLIRVEVIKTPEYSAIGKRFGKAENTISETHKRARRVVHRNHLARELGYQEYAVGSAWVLWFFLLASAEEKPLLHVRLNQLFRVFLAQTRSRVEKWDVY